MIVLALDTSADACQAAVLDGASLRATISEPMSRGHQERLAPLVRETMRQAEVTFARLDRIGVTVGPGSFTGLRIGLAFAKGLGLALDRPVLGIGSLDALAASVSPTGLVCAAIDGRRGDIAWRLYRDGAALGPPRAEPRDAAIAGIAAVRPAVVVGSAVPLLSGPPFAEADASIVRDPRPWPDIAALAWQVARVDPADHPPVPVYLRAPDAKLPGGLAPDRA